MEYALAQLEQRMLGAVCSLRIDHKRNAVHDYAGCLRYGLVIMLDCVYAVPDAVYGHDTQEREYLAGCLFLEYVSPGHEHLAAA